MQITKELYEMFDKYGKAVLTEDGSEILDDRKIDLPVGIRRPPTLLEQIKRLMRGPLAEEARQQEKETFDEANNFEAEDPEDAEFFSGYEVSPDDIPVTMKDINPVQDQGESADVVPQSGTTSDESQPATPVTPSQGSGEEIS